jgi:hypothetical protein
MVRNVFLGGLLILLSSCTSPKMVKFSYQQNFKPDTSALRNQKARLVFDDVREELRLGSWGARTNWNLADKGVRVIGSRNKEVLRRQNVLTEQYKGHPPYAIIRDFRVSWFTLSMGDLNWCDYTISTTVKFEELSLAGLAFRYLNSREYYAFFLDAKKGEAKLVLRKMDKEATADKVVWDELISVKHDFSTDKVYFIKAKTDGDEIVCFIDNSVVIKYKDSFRKSGKVALIADEPVLFGPVTVKGKKLIVETPETPEIAEPRLVFDLPLPGGSINRDFYFLDPDSDGEKEIIISERSGEKSAYRCLEFDGTELWKIDDIKYPTTEGGDYIIQVFDINGDGRNEVVAAIDFQIKVFNGKTGKLLKSVPTPNQNPYFDSRNYEYPRLLGDALCPVKIAPDKPHGFYIKDRYTNIWLYDHNMKQLWHKALGTGHFPLPVDIDDDGSEEIMVCHTLLKADGSVIWQLPLEDHVDNISYVSLNPGKDRKYFYLASGEMGLLKINPSDGEIIKRLELGHVQAISIADYVKEKEGLEMSIVTQWREDEIHYMLDKDLNILSTWQGSSGRYAVPWTKDKNEMFISSNSLIDPLTGQLVYPFYFGRVLNVFADKRWGNVLVVTEEEDHLKIFKSSNDSVLEPIEFLYSDIQSHYLPRIIKY